MAKKANTTMIGGFVVIAVCLLAASVVILGSGKLFKRTETFVLYFDNSIKGLKVGAPVMIQGVEIGSVTDISIRASRHDMSMNIPVYIEIQPDRFNVDEPNQPGKSPADTIKTLADRGMRAVLSMQSIITGQLMIELDYYPDSPIVFKNLDPNYPEIPTIPSTAERLIEKIRRVDLSRIESIIIGVDRLVNSPDLSGGLKSLRQTADESRQLVGKIDNNIDLLFHDVEKILNNADALVDNVNGQVEPLAHDMRQLIGDLDRLVQNTEGQVDVLAGNLNETLSDFRGVVSEDAQLVLQLEETLRSIANMTDSIRQLADYLEQHPEALIRGKESY